MALRLPPRYLGGYAALTWALVICVFVALNQTFADDTHLVHYVAQPMGSKVAMEGNSTIHDWSVESPIIGGHLDADSQFPQAVPGGLDAIKVQADAFIVVRTLKSHEERMDEVMQEHLKMAQFPKIEYHLLTLKPTSPPGPSVVQFDATGTLTVAGVTRTNTMPISVERLDTGMLKVSGSTPLKMTDFNVDPPAPSILGMPVIKCGDDIKISFEWMLAPK